MSLENIETIANQTLKFLNSITILRDKAGVFFTKKDVIVKKKLKKITHTYLEYLRAAVRIKKLDNVKLAPKINTRALKEKTTSSSVHNTSYKIPENSAHENGYLDVSFLPLVIPTQKQKASAYRKSNLFEPSFKIDKKEFLRQRIPTEPYNTITRQLEDIDWNSIALKEVLMDEKNNNSTPNTTRKTNTSLTPFSANFLNDDELNRMVLLEFIDEMGDFRELPILKELLAKETNTVLKEKINELLTRFKKDLRQDNQFNLVGKKVNESVFTAVLETADLETTVLLLDEIAKVGGAKEIPPLTNLLENSDPKIAAKATSTLKKVREKMKLLGQPGVTPLHTNMYAMTFEPAFSTPINKRPTVYPDIDGSTLFDHLCSFPNNIEGTH